MQLFVVAFVLHHKCPSDTDVVEYASNLITTLLVPDMTIARACEVSCAESLSLLEFVWTRGIQEATSSRWSIGKLVHTERHYYRWEFSRALTQAIRRGDPNLIHWVLDHFKGGPIAGDVVREAAKQGLLWVLQLLEANQSHGDIQWSVLVENEVEFCISSLNSAAKNGHWDVVCWLDERLANANVRTSNSLLFKYALEHGNLDRVKWVVSKGYSAKHLRIPKSSNILRDLIEQKLVSPTNFSGIALSDAAMVGDLDLVQWLLGGQATRSRPDLQCIFQGAVQAASNADVVLWLLDRMNMLGLDFGPANAMFAAARNGRLEMVQWLYKRYGRDQTTDLFRDQADEFSSNDAELHPLTVFDAAAESGSLDIIKFLHRINLPSRCKKRKHDGVSPCNHSSLNCTPMAMDIAASRGHLRVVTWLHENRSEGCTTNAMDFAAANGHFQVVEWLHSNRTEGCTTTAMDKVVAKCHRRLNFKSDKHERYRDILSFLNSNRREGCTSAAMNSAVVNGNLEMVKWLFANTNARPSPQVFDEAAGQGRLDILAWLHDNVAVKCSSSAMSNAAAHGHLEAAKWLHTNQPKIREASVTKALNSAAYQGRLNVVRWLTSCPTKVSPKSGMIIALLAGRFEVALFLQTQNPTLSASEVIDVKLDLECSTEENPGCTEIRAWLDENYQTSIPGI